MLEFIKNLLMNQRGVRVLKETVDISSKKPPSSAKVVKSNVQD